MSYSRNFYSKRHAHTEHSSRIILSNLLQVLPKINSAIDVGCGVGTWLFVLKSLGVKDVYGIDGHWVDRDLLVISEDEFMPMDLNFPIIIDNDKRYDLAISIEVAEHLTPSLAQAFCKSLVKLSDFILFSSAIPYQGGKYHLNEQWQEYWVELFHESEYVPYDFIKWDIWGNEEIPSYLKQNILFFVHRDRADEIQVEPNFSYKNFKQYSVVHPDTFVYYMEKNSTIKGRWNLLRWGIQDYVFTKVKKVLRL